MSAEIGTTHHFEPTFLEIAPNLDWDTWMEIWQFVRQNHRSSLWWVGDSLLAAEAQFPDDQWAQAVDGHAVDLYRGAMWVCRKIEPARRREAVSFSAHKEVAGLSPDEQDRWLKLIEDNGWTIRQLQDERKKEQAARLNGGYPSNDPPNEPDEPSEPTAPVLHGTPAENMDIKEETRRNSTDPDNTVEIEGLRDMIADLKKGDLFDIDSYPFGDLSLSGWMLDVGMNGKGWEVRLRKAEKQQAIAISPRLNMAVLEALLAARISDLSA